MDLVLSGEVVRADIVLDGLRVLVAEWKAKRWFNLEQDWWELGGWLELLPFSDLPMATLDGLDLIDPTWRQPWRLRGILSALSFAPSSEAEHVLKELPRRDTAFLNDHDWLGALERRSPVPASTSCAMNTAPLNQNRDIRISSQAARGPFLLLIDGEDAKSGTRITDLLPLQGTKLLLCERGSGHQFSPSSDRLYLVVAGGGFGVHLGVHVVSTESQN